MSDLITLQIAGTESEGGHILVPDFIERMEDLISVLNGIDRIVGESSQTTLDYRIVDAKHSSPLSITIEPVIKKRVARPAPEYIHVRHARFFRELSAIRRGQPVSPEMDDRMLERVRALVEGVGQQFASASISNGEAKIELDATFEANIRRLLDEEDASYGNEQGTLEALNIHGRSRTCWIYPRVGPQRIRCDFLPGTRDQIIELIGKCVWVEGVKYFRPNSPFPFRVSVRDFGILSEQDTISIQELEGIAPRAAGELSPVQFVRKIRDEWD